jgi:hypothetical protein
MTDDEVIKSHDDLEMMRRPHLWSLGYLPLKKRAWKFAMGQRRELGLLMSNGKQYQFYPGATMFEPPTPESMPIIGGDELLVKLVDNGWIVD